MSFNLLPDAGQVLKGKSSPCLALLMPDIFVAVIRKCVLLNC